MWDFGGVYPELVEGTATACAFRRSTRRACPERSRRDAAGTPQASQLTAYYTFATLSASFGGAYEVTNGAVKKYYSFAGQTIAMKDDTGLQYFLTDHLGSVVAVTDGNGTLTSQQRYLPFGEVRTNVGAIAQTDYGYTGQRDLGDELGLMDYRARFYSSALGRFTQPDSIIPNPSNPQGWNRYSYVLNSPINFNDPTGHMCSDPENEEKNAFCEGSGSTKVGNRVIRGNGKQGGGGYYPPKLKGKGGNSGGGGNNNDPGDIEDELQGGYDDTGPITDVFLNLWGSEGFYDDVATALDGVAWLTDLFAAGVVTYGGIYGAGLATPFTVVGGPAVPTVTGLAGMIIAEFYVQPILTFGNVFASASTLSTLIADTKAGNTRIEDGIFSSNVRNSFTLTVAGWVNKEAYLSLIIQSVALSNDFGWTSLPSQTKP